MGLEAGHPRGRLVVDSCQDQNVYWCAQVILSTLIKSNVAMQGGFPAKIVQGIVPFVMHK